MNDDQPKLWISGMHQDPALEEECRQMLYAGTEWFYKNPDLRPLFYGYFGMTGIIVPQNKVAQIVCREMLEPMWDKGTPNLATQQSVMSHIIAWQRRFYHHIKVDKMTPEDAWNVAWADINKEIQDRQLRPHINGPGRYDPSLPGDGTEQNDKLTPEEKKAQRARKKRVENML